MFALTPTPCARGRSERPAGSRGVAHWFLMMRIRPALCNRSRRPADFPGLFRGASAPRATPAGAAHTARYRLPTPASQVSRSRHGALFGAARSVPAFHTPLVPWRQSAKPLPRKTSPAQRIWPGPAADGPAATSTRPSLRKGNQPSAPSPVTPTHQPLAWPASPGRGPSAPSFNVRRPRGRRSLRAIPESALHR